MVRKVLVVAFGVAAAAALHAQTTARDDLARGRALWDQRLSRSAIAALDAATHDAAAAAEAWELLGRIYTYKGWRQDNVFPGWHDEPAYRERAIAALTKSLELDPARASAREALEEAKAFAAADHVDPAAPRPEIRALDAKLQSLQDRPDAPVDEVLRAIDERTRAQADPAPYFAGAQLLIARGAYDQAMATANRGASASDHFIDENLSAYQMAGKSKGSYDRGHATAADLVGWALFLEKDLPGAAEKLHEAERLYQALDFANQVHLGELERARNAPDRARDHYLDALSLSAGPAPLRQRAREALMALQPSPSFDAWLEGELARRREARMAAALRSVVNRPLPSLPLTTVDGRRYDTSDLRGKIVLLNFFASW